MTESPWWYQYRFSSIGATYFIGFFFGPLVSSLIRLDPRPLFLMAGGPGTSARHALLIAAVVLAIACFALRAWGGAYLRPDVVWNANALDDRLIVAGPFRYLRNPLYFGNLLLALGMSVFAAPLGAIVIVVGNVAVAVGLIGVEERLLAARYGPAFTAYAKAVPALVPRLLAYEAAGAAGAQGTSDAEPSFAMGAQSEILTALMALVTMSLAVYFW